MTAEEFEWTDRQNRARKGKAEADHAEEQAKHTRSKKWKEAAHALSLVIAAGVAITGACIKVAEYRSN